MKPKIYFVPCGPIRIQRKRTKGWKMPPNTVCVSRPSVWGNPIKIDEKYFITPEEAVQIYELCVVEPKIIYFYFEITVADEMFPKFEYIKNNLHKLRGKNIACWCSIVNKKGEYTPCHGDILLKLANQ